LLAILKKITPCTLFQTAMDMASCSQKEKLKWQRKVKPSAYSIQEQQASDIDRSQNSRGVLAEMVVPSRKSLDTG